MNACTYWIQHSDFSTEEFPAVDIAGALRVFRQHDWGEELRRQKVRSADGDDNCPAGIGFVSDGRLVHVCPIDGDYALVHYHTTESRRLFGLFQRQVQSVQSNPKYPLRNVGALLEHFYGHDDQWLSFELR